MDKYVNVGLNSSNGFNNAQTVPSANMNARTSHTPMSFEGGVNMQVGGGSSMSATMKDFNKRNSV